MSNELYQEPKIKSVVGISKAFNLDLSDLSERGKSFLDRRTLQLAGLRRVSDDVGHQILGKDRPQKDVEYHGLAIPYFDLSALPENFHVTEWTIRRDVPDYENDGAGNMKAKRKYIKPVSAKNRLYIPPMMPIELLKQKKAGFVFTEGEMKALALSRVATSDFESAEWSFLPVGISGVDNFRTRTKADTPDGKRLISAEAADFDKLLLKGAKAFICFDSDASEKQSVQAARARLTRFLREAGAKVFHVEFPQNYEGIPTKGIDDYLGAIEQKHGKDTAIESFLQLLEAAENPKRNASPIADNFQLVLNGEGEPGVYYHDHKENFRVCSPLEIVAETQTETGDNYGRLLRWTDSKGRTKTWAMPLELVHGDGFELVKYLVKRGLLIGASRNHHDKLKNYINLSQPEETIICTDKIGWHDGVYVFPDETIGAHENKIVYQPEYAASHKFRIKGTLEEWQENISKYCVGNSRLVFGVSLAFAASLLPIVEIPSGGFHYRDATSSGKTTAAKVSGSVFGGSSDELGYCQSWKATANGLESVAEMHNHSLLCLDELAQIDGRQAGDVAYMLASGEGTKRMTKTITARRSLSWRLLFLSTGEISLADKMSEAGIMIKGGQEIRVLDIPSDTGKFGVFENLHEFPNGQSFADHLSTASRKFYGSAIREFLRSFIEHDSESAKTGWREFQAKFIEKILPIDKNKKYPSEVYRAAARFALVAFAGEIATNLQVTKWQSGEAISAAEAVFRAWIENRVGRGGSDAERAISQIRAFIEAHGSSRFEVLTMTDDSLDTGKIINRAGFRKQNDEGEFEYLFLPEIFRQEVCKGFDYKSVCKVLARRGFLQHDSAGYQKQLKYAGTKIRPYWISSKILSDSDETTEAEKAQSANTAK